MSGVLQTVPQTYTWIYLTYTSHVFTEETTEERQLSYPYPPFQLALCGTGVVSDSLYM